jgi:hypothetical protein
LGSDFGIMDSSLQGRFSLSSAQSTCWISDSTVVSRPATGVGSTLSAYVTVARVADALSRALSYDSPSVESARVMQLQDSCTLWVVDGSNFGTKTFSQTTRVGSTQSSASSWHSDSRITCQTAPDFANNVRTRIVVTAGRLTGTTTSMRNPSMAVALVKHPNGPTSKAPLLTAVGHALGRACYSAAMRIGLSASRKTLWASETSILCTVARAQGAGSPALAAAMVLTLARARSTLSSSFSYDIASLSKVRASNVRGWSPASLLIFGANFGHVAGSPELRISTTAAMATWWASGSSITCQLVPGYHEHPLLVATVANSRATLSRAFTYDASPFLTVGLRILARLEATVWLSDTSLVCNPGTAPWPGRKVDSDGVQWWEPSRGALDMDGAGSQTGSWQGA